MALQQGVAGGALSAWILLPFLPCARPCPALFCPVLPCRAAHDLPLSRLDSTRLDLHERPPALLSRPAVQVLEPASSPASPPASPRESVCVCALPAQRRRLLPRSIHVNGRHHPSPHPALSSHLHPHLQPCLRKPSPILASRSLSPPPPPSSEAKPCRHHHLQSASFLRSPFAVGPRTPTRLASFDLHFAASTLACLPRVFGSPRQSVPAARPHIRLQVPPPFRPRPPARSRRSLVFNPNTTNPSPASTFLVCLCLDRPTVYRRDRPPNRIQPSLRRCAASLLSATHAASSLVSRLCPQQAAFSLLLPAWPTPLSRRTAFPLVLAI